MICELTSDENDLGVPRSVIYRVFKIESDGLFVFSIARQGNAMNCHFAADKRAIWHLKDMINKAVDWIFANFSWCIMILSVSDKPSVVKLIKRCHFKHVISYDEINIYMRVRNGNHKSYIL